MNKISINNADVIHCPPNWSWMSDNNGWEGYHLWYVAGGGANIKVKQKEYNISIGDTFLFDLKHNHFCTHDPRNPLYVYTAYFHSETNDIPIKRYHIRGDMILGHMLKRCIQLIRCKKEGQAILWLNPIINEFLTISKSTLNGNANKTIQLRNWLENNLNKSYNLEELSKLAGYSKNQLIRLFNSEVGMTPIQFITKLKIQHAKKMLIYSNKPIGEIANELGYNDINYFSKVFKKYVSVSPMKYRKGLINNQ